MGSLDVPITITVLIGAILILTRLYYYWRERHRPPPYAVPDSSDGAATNALSLSTSGVHPSAVGHVRQPVHIVTAAVTAGSKSPVGVGRRNPLIPRRSGSVTVISVVAPPAVAPVQPLSPLPPHCIPFIAADRHQRLSAVKSVVTPRPPPLHVVIPTTLPNNPHGNVTTPSPLTAGGSPTTPSAGLLVAGSSTSLASSTTSTSPMNPLASVVRSAVSGSWMALLRYQTYHRPEDTTATAVPMTKVAPLVSAATPPLPPLPPHTVPPMVTVQPSTPRPFATHPPPGSGLASPTTATMVGTRNPSRPASPSRRPFSTPSTSSTSSRRGRRSRTSKAKPWLRFPLMLPPSEEVAEEEEDGSEEDDWRQSESSHDRGSTSSSPSSAPPSAGEEDRVVLYQPPPPSSPGSDLLQTSVGHPPPPPLPPRTSTAEKQVIRTPVGLVGEPD
ncbi:hypothetical protein BC828DRAFT_392144 [Blastocladiella britannica]|nr:hypothetical protein BC828DRAFT_392144 [Blastocladiella britannica]